MMRVFIDTNVFIDLIMKREDFLAAARVFSCANMEGITLHASVLTMANIAYVLRKAVGKLLLYDELSKFDEFVSIESLTFEDYRRALSLHAKDFEDALQFACAMSTSCDVIVTRNKKDFIFEGIKIMTPSEFLDNI